MSDQEKIKKLEIALKKLMQDYKSLRDYSSNCRISANETKSYREAIELINK